MTQKTMAVCERSQARYTRRDALIGAGVMLGATLFFTMTGVASRRAGWHATGGIVTSLAFSASLMLSMPFWLMKGQSRKAQAVIVGGTLAFLIAIGWVATLL